MSRHGTSYQNCNHVQKALMARVEDAETKPRDVAVCAEKWIAVEKFKREIRGIPPLAPMSAREMKKLREALDRRKREPRALMVEADIVTDTPGG